MSSSVPMTEIDGSYFKHDNAAGRLTDVIQELMSGEIPAFIIRQACEDIDSVTIEAFKESGWSLVRQEPSFYVKVNAWESMAAFGFRSRHIEKGGFTRYPEYDIGGIHVRGHDAIKGAADVWTRSATRKEVGSPSHRFNMFVSDRKNRVYTTTQKPGDRVMFILYGGIIDGVVIPPAEHDFKREKVAAKSRQVRLTGFVVLPTE